MNRILLLLVTATASGLIGCTSMSETDLTLDFMKLIRFSVG